MTNGTTGDAILVGAYLNNIDFVRAAAGNIAAPDYSTNNVLNTWANDNILVNGAVSGQIGSGTINSLKLNSGQIPTSGANGNTLTIASGMILVNNVNATIGSVVGNGIIRTGNGQDLIVNQVTGNALTMNSQIDLSSGSLTNALTKTGAGVLVLANSANVVGQVYVNAGTLQVNANGALGSNNNVYLFGDTLRAGVTGLTLRQNITVGPQGRALQLTANGGNLTISGSMTLNGLLTLYPDNNNNSLTVTLNGPVSGAGTIYLNNSGSNLRNQNVLGGNNSSWTGGVLLNAVKSCVWRMPMRPGPVPSGRTPPPTTEPR